MLRSYFVSSVLVSLLHSRRFMVRSRVSLHVEIIALRYQLAVVNRSRRPRLRFTSADRILWVWLSQAWRAGARRFTSSGRTASSRGTGAGSVCSGRGRVAAASAAQPCHTIFLVP